MNQGLFRKNGGSAGLLLVLAMGGVLNASCGNVGSEPAAAAQEGDRKEVTLTIYQGDFGMVREVRDLAIQRGRNSLYLKEVSKRLDPQSVVLKWLGEGGAKPVIVSHAYDLGVSGGEELAGRYLGKEVEMVRYGQDGRVAETQKGRLMTGGDGNYTLQTEDKFYINPQGTLVAPATPDIVTIPQVSVQAESAGGGRGILEFAYLTQGLVWGADYMATLAPDSDQLRLECWATVTNHTGTNYPNAKVTLVAGSPNRAVVSAQDREKQKAEFEDGAGGGRAMRKSRFLAEAPAAKPAFVAAPEMLGEMHAYPVSAPTTVVQEQMNRLMMFSSEKIAIKRDYSVHMPSLSPWEPFSAGAPPVRGSVAVGVSFYNKESEGLGMPMPAGAVRIYEPDATGVLRYVGAGSIENTPSEQKIYVALAGSFDVFTERKLVKSVKIDKKTLRQTVEVTLHNQKGVAISLRVLQELYGQWRIAEESQKSTRLNAHEAQWKVSLPPKSKTVLRYVVDLKF